MLASILNYPYDSNVVRKISKRVIFNWKRPQLAAVTVCKVHRLMAVHANMYSNWFWIQRNITYIKYFTWREDLLKYWSPPQIFIPIMNHEKYACLTTISSDKWMSNIFINELKIYNKEYLQLGLGSNFCIKKPKCFQGLIFQRISLPRSSKLFLERDKN